MIPEDVDAQKRIPIGLVTPGMYVMSLDRSWLETPFFFHRKLIKSAEDIELLKRNGIREVVIDITRGLDVESVPTGKGLTAGPSTAAAKIVATEKDSKAR